MTGKLLCGTVWDTELGSGEGKIYNLPSKNSTGPLVTVTSERQKLRLVPLLTKAYSFTIATRHLVNLNFSKMENY